MSGVLAIAAWWPELAAREPRPRDVVPARERAVERRESTRDRDVRMLAMVVDDRPTRRTEPSTVGDEYGAWRVVQVHGRDARGLEVVSIVCTRCDGSRRVAFTAVVRSEAKKSAARGHVASCRSCANKSRRRKP